MDDMENVPEVETVVDNSEVAELIAPDEHAQVEISLTDDAVAPIEEVVEEKPKKTKPKSDGLARIKQLSREKYHAEYIAKTKEEEVEKLRAEVERLKVLSDQNSQAAMSHFDDSVKRQMDQARFRMTKAIQEGDVEEQLKATEELTEAKARQIQIESWNANNYYAQQKESSPVPQEKPYIEQRQVEIPVEQPQLTPEANEWIRNNSWVNPNSADFDEGLLREVQAYEQVLYNKYQRLGQEDKILSREYFDDIDRYIRTEFAAEEEAPVQPQRTLNMKPTRAPVAPVSHSRSTVQNSAPKFRLPQGMSESEFKSFIQNMGITEADYMKNMKEHLVEQDNRYQNAIRQGKF